MNGRSGKIVSWRLGYKQHVQWPVWNMVKVKTTSQSSGGKKEAVSASSKPSWQEIGWSCCLGSKLVVKPCRWLYTCPNGYIPNIGCDWIPEMVGYVKYPTWVVCPWWLVLSLHYDWFCGCVQMCCPMLKWPKIVNPQNRIHTKPGPNVIPFAPQCAGSWTQCLMVLSVLSYYPHIWVWTYFSLIKLPFCRDIAHFQMHPIFTMVAYRKSHDSTMKKNPLISHDIPINTYKYS